MRALFVTALLGGCLLAPVAGFREHDTCSGIATIYTASTGDTSATYAVRPLAPGTCTATVRDEGGASTTVPIVVR